MSDQDRADQDRADEDRSFDPNTVSANRAQTQGLGVGQKELNAQQAPDRDLHATDPQRTEPFDRSLDAPAGRGRGAAGVGEVGDLGAGTPPGVDIHNLGQADNPELEWGEAAGERATFSSTNTRKGVRTEAERGQGAKTRQLNKDIVSRRT